MLFSRKQIARSLVPAGAAKRPNYSKHQLSGPDWANWAKSPTAIFQFPSNAIPDSASFMKTYFAAVARYIPTASDAVWIWTYLCNTKQETKLSGGTEEQQNRAKQLLYDLDKKLSPLKTVRDGGMDFLNKLMFSSLFTYGRFCGKLVLDPNLTGVHAFDVLDPFSVIFDKNYDSYYRNNEKSNLYTQNNPNTFYYYGLEMSMDNPYGSAMVESCRTLIGIANDMMRDMSLSSANAGVPRLHIKIKQPQQYEWEDPEDYRSRIGSYFTETISQFSDIGPDDNVYSWDDVEIGTVSAGSGPAGFVWRTNRAVVDEEIIGGFHLYPWIFGRSLSTTKNWVRSQFDILMSQVASLQKEAKRFSEWIANTHLALSGLSEVTAHRSMIMPRDPAIKEIAVAQHYHIRNVDSKVRKGVISPDAGARELGYDKAFDPALWLASDKDKGDLPGDDSDNQYSDLDSDFFQPVFDRIESLRSSMEARK